MSKRHQAGLAVLTAGLALSIGSADADNLTQLAQRIAAGRSAAEKVARAEEQTRVAASEAAFQDKVDRLLQAWRTYDNPENRTLAAVVGPIILGTTANARQAPKVHESYHNYPVAALPGCGGFPCIVPVTKSRMLNKYSPHRHKKVQHMGTAVNGPAALAITKSGLAVLHYDGSTSNLYHGSDYGYEHFNHLTYKGPRRVRTGWGARRVVTQILRQHPDLNVDALVGRFARDYQRYVEKARAIDRQLSSRDQAR